MKTIQYLKTFGLVALFCILSINLQAQRPQRAELGLKLKAELALTDGQWGEIQELREGMHTQMRALRENGPDPSNREKAREIMEDYQTEFEAILNDEQKEKWAKMKENRKEGMERRRGRMQAMRNGKGLDKRAEIHGVLIEKRTELDQYISSSDQQMINELREKLAIAHTEMKSKMQERKKKISANDEDVRPHMQKRFGQGVKGKRSHIQEEIFSEEDKANIESLVEKYADQIDALTEELANRRPAHIEIPEEKRAMIAQKHKAHFLLMDPAKMAERAETMDKRTISVYPNPGSTQQTISFDIQKAGEVSVEIIDKNGNIVQKVFNGSLEKGKNKLDVSIGNLKSDVYFYRITDAEGTTSTPFIIQ